VNDYSDVGVFSIQRCFSDITTKKVMVVLFAQPTGGWFDMMSVVIENMNQGWFQ